MVAFPEHILRLDTRVGPRVGPSRCIPLSIPPLLFGSGLPARLFAMCPCPYNSYHIGVVTSTSILLIDERYPSSPLLQWNHHQLSNPPRWITFHRLPHNNSNATVNNHDISILTWSTSCDPMMYSYRTSSHHPMTGPSGMITSRALPISTHSRRSLSSFHSLATHIDDLLSKPEQSIKLIGMTLFPTFPSPKPPSSSSSSTMNKNPTYYVLQLSHHGSILCQGHRIGNDPPLISNLATRITHDDRYAIPGSITSDLKQFSEIDMSPLFYHMIGDQQYDNIASITKIIGWLNDHQDGLLAYLVLPHTLLDIIRYALANGLTTRPRKIRKPTTSSPSITSPSNSDSKRTSNNLNDDQHESSSSPMNGPVSGGILRRTLAQNFTCALTLFVYYHRRLPEDIADRYTRIEDEARRQRDPRHAPRGLSSTRKRRHADGTIQQEDEKEIKSSQSGAATGGGVNGVNGISNSDDIDDNDHDSDIESTPLPVPIYQLHYHRIFTKSRTPNSNPNPSLSSSPSLSSFSAGSSSPQSNPTFSLCSCGEIQRDE